MSPGPPGPPELDRVRARALRAIAPIKAADEQSEAEDDFLFRATQLEARGGMPRHHLVFFLLVELLGFKNLGRFEKIAWSVPIDFVGKAYLIEHRKFGIGVFGTSSEQAELDAARIVSLVRRGVRAAQPFFRSLADKAVAESRFNVVNNSVTLFARYEYLRGLYAATRAEADALGDTLVDVTETTPDGKSRIAHRFVGWELAQKADWLGMSAIDAFFSWTEHVFIHLALLQGRISTGEEVAKLAGAEWGDKFKAALNMGDRETKRHFDELALIRRQVRNFIAHGAFGKQGEAFHFHSRAGTAPVILDYTGPSQRFTLSAELAFNDDGALRSIGAFIAHLWSGPRKAAKLYIQDAGLPLILTKLRDGTYKKAMTSMDDMNKLAAQLSWQIDAGANMDW